MKRLAKITFLVLAVVFLANPLANAQANQPEQESSREERITLSPAVYRPDFSAGDQAQGKLTVINDGSVDYSFVLYARPFSVTGEQYDPNYTEVNERTEAYQWVQFDRTSLNLKAGESVEVAYTITVPANAAPGGHYAVLFAETQPSGDGSNIARKKRVGSLLYMTVDGNITRAGSLASWSVPFWQMQKPITSNVRIKNDGNVHFQANLSANYTNLFGKKRFELNQELLIMPGTTRRVPVAWENPPLFGVFKAGGTITYLDKTEELPTRWVVYMPRSLVFALSAVILLCIALAVVRKRRNGKAGAPGRGNKK